MDASAAARLIATWFGAGRSPVAPGTVGTIAALPVHWVLRSVAPVPYAAAVILVTVAGTWAAEREALRLGEKDPSSVVVDEVAGVLLALFIARGAGLKAEIVSVLLFRLFDIWKPGPIDRIQHLEPAGVGIMADDILAGALAGVLARLL